VPHSLRAGLRFCCFGLIASLIACGGEPGTKKTDDRTEGWSVDKLYQEARKAALDGGYVEAIDLYEKLEARYPYGAYAQQALIDVAYSYYKNGDAELSIEAADRFIRLYPLHPNVEYAYYLKGLVHFRREVSILEKWLPQNIAARDVSNARLSFDDFSQLLRGFPESRYALDARQRMVYLRNQLAEHDILVARYYVKRGAYLAVASRARHVLEAYPRSQFTPDALELMVTAYRILGLETQASDALRVLNLNYPSHPATERAGKLAVLQ
jgi:outer membrane protein assembly factor BamD